MNSWHYGDVLMVDLDPAKGHEQRKRRPCVVVSNDDFNHSCTLTIVLAISYGRPDFELHLPFTPVHCEELEDGVLDGYVQVEQMRALDLRQRDAVKIGHLGDDDLDRITGTLIACFIQPNMMVIPDSD